MQKLHFMAYKDFITPWKITSSPTSCVSIDVSKV